MSKKAKRLIWVALAGAVAGMLIGLPLVTLGTLALAMGIAIGART